MTERFKGHAKLIDKFNIVTSISGSGESVGNQRFFDMKETIVTQCLHELIDMAAMKLSNAGLVGRHLVYFDLVVHAQQEEIQNDFTGRSDANIEFCGGK